MKYKVIFLLAAILMTIIPVSGCTLFKSGPIISGAGSANNPKTVSLSLSKAPKLGETAELELEIPLNYFTWVFYKDVEQSNSIVKAWVEFTWANPYGSYLEAKYAVPVPLEEVLVDGDLSWEGNCFQPESPLKIRSTIKFPREGVWEITGYCIGENKDPSAFLGQQEEPVTDSLRIVVEKDMGAAWGSREIYNSPLAYLMNYNYGRASRPILSSWRPVFQELDLSKAPRKGEEVTLTCQISSLYDIQDFSTAITFFKRTKGNSADRVAGEKLLVEGPLSWTGDLKKDQTVEFSSIIKFPGEGDWRIHVQGSYSPSGNPGFAHQIDLNISSNQSSFGWRN